MLRCGGAVSGKEVEDHQIASCGGLPGPVARFLSGFENPGVLGAGFRVTIAVQEVRVLLQCFHVGGRALGSSRQSHPSAGYVAGLFKLPRFIQSIVCSEGGEQKQDKDYRGRLHYGTPVSLVTQFTMTITSLGILRQLYRKTQPSDCKFAHGDSTDRTDF